MVLRKRKEKFSQSKTKIKSKIWVIFRWSSTQFNKLWEIKFSHVLWATSWLFIKQRLIAQLCVCGRRCRWFLQFVLAWLAENEEVSMEFMHGALERDKREGVSQRNQNVKGPLWSFCDFQFCSISLSLLKAQTCLLFAVKNQGFY